MRKQTLHLYRWQRSCSARIWNAVMDENRHASTLVMKKVKTSQWTAQRVAKFISRGEGSCFEYQFVRHVDDAIYLQSYSENEDYFIQQR